MASKLWNWFKQLAWYWKVLGFGILLLIGIIYVLNPKTYLNFKSIDKFQKGKTEVKLNTLKEDRKNLQKKITRKKAAILKSMIESNVVLNKAAKRKMQLRDATTMEELDKLQKEFGL